jgi:cell division protein FtsQ
MVKKTNKYRFKQLNLMAHLRLPVRLLVVSLAFGALSALFVWGYRTLLVSPLLRVTRIQVSGCLQLDPQTVIKQAAIPSGANILSLDLATVSRRVTDHPWVRSAVVRREIPDRIHISMEERQPVALVRGRNFLLSDLQGVCFTQAVPSEYPGLPIITGFAPETLAVGDQLPQEFIHLLQDLHGECRRQLPWRLISEIQWNSLVGLSLFTVRNGIQIVLGSSNYGPRIARLEKILRYLEKEKAHSQVRSMDMSYGDRAFVKGNFQMFRQNRSQGRGV